MNRQFDEATGSTNPRVTSGRDDEPELHETFLRLETKVDNWFNFQYLLIAILGVLILFDDEIRSALGL